MTLHYLLASAIAAAAAAAATATFDATLVSAFADFQKTYGKSYSDEEFPKRLEIFAGNLERAKELNVQNIALGGGAVHGVTKFSDLSPEEFRAKYLNFVPPKTKERNGRAFSSLDKFKDVGQVPPHIDWSDKGATTPIKDQGQCDASWAMSVTEVIESYSFLASGTLNVLSSQQITSCDPHNSGCKGGWPQGAYNYTRDAGGLELERDYPFTSGGGETGKCTVNSSKIVPGSRPVGFVDIAPSEFELMLVTSQGPPLVCVAGDAFQTYRGGDLLLYCPGSINLCVQAVGYSTSPPAYWTVRNSWGTDWGISGYLVLGFGKDVCQISQMASIPIFKNQTV